MLEDGRVLDVIAVVSCVGFRPDYGWIDGLPVGEDGYPIERDGSAPELPGLHFVGLKFQRAFASMLVGGAGRDAAAIAGRIAASARRVA
jgi:putative flavoprotein involved in K+ transport